MLGSKPLAVSVFVHRDGFRTALERRGAGALRRAGSQKLFPSAGTDAGTDRIFAGAG